MVTRQLPPLTNLHLGKVGDLRYLKAYLQYLAGRRESPPSRWIYKVGKHQAILIERYAQGLVNELRIK